MKMGAGTSHYLIKHFYLPLICLCLLLGGGIYYGSKEQVRFQKIDALLQGIDRLEFALVQLKAAPQNPEAEMASIQLNILEYTLYKTIAQFSVVRDGNKQEQAFLNSLEETYLFFSGRAGKDQKESETVKESIQKLEKILSENKTLRQSLQKEAEWKGKYQELLIYVPVAAVVLLLFLVISFFYLRILRPLKEVKGQAEALANGEEKGMPARNSNVLFSGITDHITQHKSHLSQLSNLADQIGEGNFEQEKEEFERAGALGRSIGRMRERIQASFRDEEKRRWSNEGLANFSHLVREFSHDPEILCPKFLTQLVPFLGANQGALFLLEQSGKEAELQLKASYAWGKQKHQKKSYWVGEGLIGQVALDHDMIFLTDIPDNFISIGSGLGDANPGSIAILPLVAGEQLHGVLEVASFEMFEEHQITFLKRLCEVLASAIAMAKGNQVTRQLLEKAEDANVQLKAQEEELRQNTEELMSTQEAMMRKEAELSGLFASINYNMLTAEIDGQGRFSKLNDKLAGMLGGEEKEYLERGVCEVFQVPEWEKEDYEELLAQLKNGAARNIECRLKRNPAVWLSASFTPVKNKEGKLIMIMLLAYDISEKKEAEEIYKGQAEEIKKQEEQLRRYTVELESLQANLESRLKEATEEMERQIQEIESEKTKHGAILEGCVDGVVSFNESGQIEYFNKAAEEIWEMSRQEALEKRIEDFIPVEILMVDGEALVYYSKNGGRKILDARTEVPVIGKAGQEMEVLLTLTRVKVEGRYTFTAFAQKVAVELF